MFDGPRNLYPEKVVLDVSKEALEQLKVIVETLLDVIPDWDLLPRISSGWHKSTDPQLPSYLDEYLYPLGPQDEWLWLVLSFDSRSRDTRLRIERI